MVPGIGGECVCLSGAVFANAGAVLDVAGSQAPISMQPTRALGSTCHAACAGRGGPAPKKKTKREKNSRDMVQNSSPSQEYGGGRPQRRVATKLVGEEQLEPDANLGGTGRGFAVAGDDLQDALLPALLPG